MALRDYFYNVIRGIMLIMLVTGCSHQPVNQVTHPSSSVGVVLWLNEKRASTPEEPVRLLINENYLRIDQGPDSEDYMIFDRRNQIIFNIVAEEKTISSIKFQPVTIEPVVAIQWEVTSQPSHALPKAQLSQSLQAIHYRYDLAGTTCYQVVAIPQVLKVAVTALQEYREVLAGEWAKSYQADSSLDAQCWAAVNIFTPAIVLAHGFPMREWNKQGYQRFLLKYQLDQVLPAEWFILPEGYRVYNP